MSNYDWKTGEEYQEIRYELCGHDESFFLDGHNHDDGFSFDVFIYTEALKKRFETEGM